MIDRQTQKHNPLLGRLTGQVRSAVALIDGEHYPPVIRSALERLAYERGWRFVAALLLGGTEKIKAVTDLEELGVPLLRAETPQRGLAMAADLYSPEVFVDLSDEPVVSAADRLRLASFAMARGISYIGADFHFDPIVFEAVVEKPCLAVIGTSKRIGKTAISAAISSGLKALGTNPVVVAMGRGGPETPEHIGAEGEPLSVATLMQLSDSGRHAASDYLENAIMSGVAAIGTRRCGGGLAGSPFVSNVREAALMANRLPNDVVIFDGSGAAIPPVRTDLRVLVLSAQQSLDYVNGYFGPYRVMISDVAVLTMCEEPFASPQKVEEMTSALRTINPDIQILTSYFRPRPLAATATLYNKRVFVATTAPEAIGLKLRRHLESTCGCEVVGMTHWLARRDALRAEVEGVLSSGRVDLLLTELKAAAVDVVSKLGEAAGVETMLYNNIPEHRGDGPGFTEELSELLMKKLAGSASVASASRARHHLLRAGDGSIAE